MNKSILIIFTNFNNYKIFNKYFKVYNSNFYIKTMFISDIFKINYKYEEKIFKNIDFLIKEYKIFNLFKNIDYTDEIYIEFDDNNSYYKLMSVIIEKYIRKNLNFNSLLFFNSEELKLEEDIKDFILLLSQNSFKINKGIKKKIYNEYIVDNIINYYTSINISNITNKFIFYDKNLLEILLNIKKFYNKKNNIYIYENTIKNINIKDIKYYNNEYIYNDLMYILINLVPFSKELEKKFMNVLLELIEYDILEYKNKKLYIKEKYVNNIDLKKLLKNKRIDNKLILNIYYLLNFFNKNQIEVNENKIIYNILGKNETLKVLYNSNENNEFLNKFFDNNKILAIYLLSVIDNKYILTVNEIHKEYKNNFHIKKLFSLKKDINYIFKFINYFSKKRLITLKMENIQLSKNFIYLLNYFDIENYLINLNKIKKILKMKIEELNLKITDKEFLFLINEQLNNISVYFNISNYQKLQKVFKYIKNNDINLKLAKEEKKFIEIYHDKKKFNNLISNINYTEKPTEKQILLLNKIKEELKIKISEEAYKNKEIARNIIKENINKLKLPTQKMINLAQKIITTFKLNIDEEKIFSSFEECKKFLNMHL